MSRRSRGRRARRRTWSRKKRRRKRRRERSSRGGWKGAAMWVGGGQDPLRVRVRISFSVSCFWSDRRDGKSVKGIFQMHYVLAGTYCLFCYAEIMFLSWLKINCET